MSGPILAEEIEEPSDHYGAELQVPPFKIDSTKKLSAFEKIAEEMRSEVQRYNNNGKAKLAQLSLDSGTDSDLLGGICSTDTGLAGILKRYYRETFAEDVWRSSNRVSAQDVWLGCAFGAVSRHRRMLRAGESMVEKYGTRVARKLTNLESYLTEKDHNFAISHLPVDCTAIVNQTRSMKGIMDHLESLHHSSVPFIEGLTVELLEFQRQSVQWALERETTPGGVQSFLWAKLPSVAEPGNDLYFSPILERFRHDKPQLVRGGFISEEMGLGKTVISLALILQNPAPAMPLSGSPVTTLAAGSGTESGQTASGQASWDGDLHSRTSQSNGKRGSIISRGTLVVVSVRLIGCCQYC